MSDLTPFSKDEVELLASLPYKVGMWISYADDQDGENDDKLEEKALHSGLKQFAKMQDDGTLVDDVMRECLKRTDKHAEWADQSFNVVLDIKKAVELLRQKVPADDIKALKRALMEIGSTVAQASSEYGQFDEGDNEGLFGKIIGKLSGLASDDSGHPMNVSATEDSNLQKLRDVLRGKA